MGGYMPAKRKRPVRSAPLGLLTVQGAADYLGCYRHACVSLDRSRPAAGCGHRKPRRGPLQDQAPAGRPGGLHRPADPRRADATADPGRLTRMKTLAASTGDGGNDVCAKAAGCRCASPTPRCEGKTLDHKQNGPPSPAGRPRRSVASTATIHAPIVTDATGIRQDPAGSASRLPVAFASQAEPCAGRALWALMYRCGACGGTRFGRSRAEVSTGKRTARCGRVVWLVISRTYRGSQ